MSNLPRPAKLIAFFLIGVALGLAGLFIYERTTAAADEGTAGERVAAEWSVGELRPDGSGLRIVPRGRADASAVLDAEQFTRPEVRRAYRIAAKIPAVLNKLYCWCRCEDRGVHRSNLACFEDRMSAGCAVCRGTAEIAYRMVQNGITDAGRIQAAVDARWGRS